MVSNVLLNLWLSMEKRGNAWLRVLLCRTDKYIFWHLIHFLYDSLLHSVFFQFSHEYGYFSLNISNWSVVLVVSLSLMWRFIGDQLFWNYLCQSVVKVNGTVSNIRLIWAPYPDCFCSHYKGILLPVNVAPYWFLL